MLSLAPGPHPRRDLTLIPRLGFACPRLGMAAGALSLAPGPHPRRDLTLIPRLGFACPRLGMAAGAPISRSHTFFCRRIPLRRLVTAVVLLLVGPAYPRLGDHVIAPDADEIVHAVPSPAGVLLEKPGESRVERL